MSTGDGSVGSMLQTSAIRTMAFSLVDITSVAVVEFKLFDRAITPAFPKQSLQLSMQCHTIYSIRSEPSHDDSVPGAN